MTKDFVDPGLVWHYGSGFCPVPYSSKGLSEHREPAEPEEYNLPGENLHAVSSVSSAFVRFPELLAN